MNARVLSVACLALSLVACKSSFDSAEDSDASTTQADDTNADAEAGDGDDATETSSSDSDTNTSAGDGDDDTTTGDGDDTTTGDGDDTTTGDGDDTTTGDGDDTTTGDGDGDGDGEGDYCNGATALTFNDPFDRNVGASITHLVAGDFVGDGATDLLAGASDASFFVTMRNNGGGGNFPDSQIESVDLGTETLQAINLGLLDAGNKQDVLIVTENGVIVYLGTGGETLGSSHEIAPATAGSVNYHAGAIVDIGGMSERGDIIVSRQNQGNEEVIVFDGATFDAVGDPDFVFPATGNTESARRMLTGRFNSDNDYDVVMLLQSDFGMDGTVSTLLNPAGSELAFDGPHNLTTLHQNTNGVAADLDLDGHNDLLISEGGQFGDALESVHIYWGSSTGFSNADKTTIEVGDLLGFPAIADFNCDGHRDFAVAVAGEGRIAFYMGDSARNFTFDSEITLAQSGPYALVAGDFNGDGAPDLAASVPMLERMLIYNQQ